VLCAAATLMGFGSLAFTSVPGDPIARVGVGSCGHVRAVGVVFSVAVAVVMKERSSGQAARTPGRRGTCCVLLLALAAARLRRAHRFVSVSPRRRSRIPGMSSGSTSTTMARGFWHRLRLRGTWIGCLRRRRRWPRDRTYRLSDYANGTVTHVILLLDSLPYETMLERYRGGDYRWFGPPRKMIAPFPSLTEVCYTETLHGPPLAGGDRPVFRPVAAAKRMATLWKRVRGYSEPWERRARLSHRHRRPRPVVLDPDKWFASELRAGGRAVEESPDRVPVVYISAPPAWSACTASQAPRLCSTGRGGCCLQLLYERRGRSRSQ